MIRQPSNTAKKKCDSPQSRNYRDYNNSCTLDANQICANCCSPIDSYTSKAQEIPLNSSQQQSSTYSNNFDVDLDELVNSTTTNEDSPKTCDFNKRLSEIYNLDFIPRLLQKYPNAPKEILIGKEEFGFPLCMSCTDLFKPLFSLYSQFNQIREIDSLLSKQISVLNSLIDYDSQYQNSQSNRKRHAGHDPKEISNPKIRNIGSSSSRRKKSKLHSSDPELSVRVVPLEHLTVAEIGYAPPSLCHLYQEAPKGTSNPIKQEMTNQPANEKKPSYHGKRIKLEFSVKDQRPWVKVESRMENLTIKKEEIAQALLTRSNLYQEAPHSSSTYSDMFSSLPGNDDNDDDMDFEPSFLPHDDGDVNDDEDFSPTVKNKTQNAGKSKEESEDSDENASVESDMSDDEAKSKNKTKTKNKGKGKASSSGQKKHRCTVIINEAGDVCPYRTKNAGNLKIHMFTVHADEKDKARCSECGKEFKCGPALQSHFKRMHTEEGRKVYEKYRERMSNLQRARYKMEKKFQCTAVINNDGDVCPFRAPTPQILKAHVRKTHASEKDKVKCDQCNKVVKSAAHLKHHVYYMHTEKGLVKNEKRKEYKRAKRVDEGTMCPHCNIDFITKIRYTKHMRQVHDDYGKNGINMLMCEICGKKFECKATLTKHVEVIHTVQSEERPYACDVCGRTYKAESSLLTHKAESHDEEGRKRREAKQREHKKIKRMIKEQEKRKAGVDGTVCPHCGIDFLTKLRCTKHRRTVHDDYVGTWFQVVTCEVCGKKCDGTGSLKYHMKHVHSDERPFVCDQCGLCYKSEPNLQHHKTTNHTEEGRMKQLLKQREGMRRRRLIKAQEARIKAGETEVDLEALAMEIDSKKKKSSDSTKRKRVRVRKRKQVEETAVTNPPPPSTSTSSLPLLPTFLSQSMTTANFDCDYI